jgi:predicted RNase H-like HicB family nuclease
MQAIRTYHTELGKDPESSYTAIVPSLPVCITWGETVEDPLGMASDAIEGYIAVLIDEGEPIPE